jgi:hypothetical protein
VANSPFQFPTRVTPLPTLQEAMKNSLKHPPIGLTQGGSGRRKSRGAKVAATDALMKAPRK